MDQLLVALDVDTAAEAVRLSDELRGLAGGFKIGSRLFTAEGPDVVRRMVDRGDRVFLDLKYYDIPSTVAGAVRVAKALGVWMLTVHASGGADMLRAAKEAAVGGGNPTDGPKIVAVTVLTSFDDTGLRRLGITRAVEDQVDALAAIARESGVDGVVASPLEIGRIRETCGPTFTIVTPGIRPASHDASFHDGSDDQSRTLNAGKAVRRGASYLVVGRPIYTASDPRAAADALCREIAAT